MQEYFVLVVVVLISIVAHLWLFIWIRFRIDEAVVLKCFEDEILRASLPFEVIAERLNFKLNRVAVVCAKSKKIRILNSNTAELIEV